jgi:asparagine N-glycosylation enzyme membrane subunit Stt3
MARFLLPDPQGGSVPRETEGSMGLILLIVLVVLLIGAVPRWPHSRSWGYFPSGFLGLVLVIVLILFLLGRI